MAHNRQLTVSQFYALQYLCEVAAHYNSGNRSRSIGGPCLYIPDDPKKSQGCAIGRKLTEVEKETIKDLDINRLGVEEVIAKIGPLEFFRLISTYYLILIQDFHDVDKWWDYNGLSEEGRKQFQYYYKRIVNNQSQ